MKARDLSHPTVLWKPTDSSGIPMKKFWRHISEKYHVKIDNLWELHRWTVENLEDFWAEIWKTANVISSKPYDRVVDTSISIADRPEWFPGARMNYAENLLKFRDDHVALIAMGEEREAKHITYAEVYREACKYGASLRKLGLKKGDCVVCYMPNREEPVYAMLGATSIGAVWSGTLPTLGSKAAVNRFKQTEPKFLFVSDRFLNDGEEIEMLSKVKEVADELPSLIKVVITPSSTTSRLKDISDIRNSCYLDEFLKIGENPDGTVPDLEFEQVSFSHPVSICYTSGTTGTPKALVHGSSILLTMFRDFCLHITGSRENCWLSMSPVGWASWNMFVSMLFLGMTVMLYEGVPYYKSPTSLWDMVDQYQITNLLLTPTVLDELEKRGYVPSEKNHLTSLRTIICGASVVKHQNYDFVYQKVKRDIIFGSVYGCTEVISVCVLLDETIPVHRGETSTPGLGIAIRCYNDEGRYVEGEPGDLVITTHVSSFPLAIWGDTDGRQFKEKYFSKYPGEFCTGDIGIINPVTRGLIVLCRSDDTLKPKGCRFGSSEIYNVVDKFLEVEDSLCVSQYNHDGDERAVLFLKMRNNYPFNEGLAQRIRKAIEKELSHRHVPSVILETKEIPHNFNGKKMEIIVKKIINKMSYDPETVENIECLKNFENVPELQGF